MWAAGSIWLGEEFHEGVEGSWSMLVALGGGALIGVLVAVGARMVTPAVRRVIAIQAVLAVAVAKLTWPALERWRAGEDVELLAGAQRHLSGVVGDRWIAFNVVTGAIFAGLGGLGIARWLDARTHGPGGASGAAPADAPATASAPLELADGWEGGAGSSHVGSPWWRRGRIMFGAVVAVAVIAVFISVGLEDYAERDANGASLMAASSSADTWWVTVSSMRGERAGTLMS
jgi:hypothetical protein